MQRKDLSHEKIMAAYEKKKKDLHSKRKQRPQPSAKEQRKATAKLNAALVSFNGSIEVSSPNPTTEKLTTEKLTTEKLTTEKPTTEKPTTEKPTTEKPTTEKPTTEKPTTEKPTTEKPTTEKPTTENPTEPDMKMTYMSLNILQERLEADKSGMCDAVPCVIL
eukprot:g3795.t1